ncbi:MAG: winged helix DNA-binding protein [Sphingobium sp.]
MPPDPAIAAPSSLHPFGSPDHRPGLIIIGDLPAGLAASALANAGDFRLLDQFALTDATERLDRQIAGDVALLFCEGAPMLIERLIVQLETVSVQSGMRLITVADPATLDLVFACARRDSTQLLCDPAPADLATALVLARRDAAPVRTLHDFGRDDDGTRLQQLSEEVGRLARTLESLTRNQPAAAPSFQLGPRISDRSSDYIGMPALPPIGGLPVQEAMLEPAHVRDLLRARRMRADFLPDDLFADPAWDMLLDLLAARLEHERVSVSSLCIASAVPPTTALRWIKTLTDRGLLVRQADPHDGRRIFIALSDRAADALAQWFAASRRYRCPG